jgi:hypothetical protein
VDTTVAQDKVFEIVETERPFSHRQLSSTRESPLPSSALKNTKIKAVALEDAIVCSTPTPKRHKAIIEIPVSPSKLPSTKRGFQARRELPHENAIIDNTNALSTQLPTCLAAQKKEILRRLQTGSFDNLDTPATEATVQKQLSEVIQGSIIRGEGNSCIVLGPRGSGKTRVRIHDLHAFTRVEKLFYR